MDDHAIIRLFWDRDEAAIAETAAKYGSYCHTIAGNILGNGEDAEECVNDTYLRAWQSIPPHSPQVLRTYLGMITRNISFNRYNKLHTKKRGGGQIEAVLEELAEFVSGGSEPEQELDRKELVRAIDEFLAGLPKEKRVMFVCRYWYSDSVADIARRCSVSENNVSVTLNRLRKKLGSYLTERGFEL